MFNILDELQFQPDWTTDCGGILFSRCLSVRNAHLHRLRGELIVYPCSSVHHTSSVRQLLSLSTISSIFFSETAWPIKAKSYMEPLWVGGTKVCSWHLGHMTKMTITPIYGKTLQKSPESLGRLPQNFV